jgi:hypothetical protein
MGDLSEKISTRRKLCLKVTEQNQTTESYTKIKYIPLEHQFFPPDYSATLLNAKMCTNSK